VKKWVRWLLKGNINPSTFRSLRAFRPRNIVKRPPKRSTQRLRRIVEEAHEHARQILTEKRDLLDNVAKILLEKEVIEGQEIKRIISEAA
jgi:cell division protease FtsH